MSTTDDRGWNARQFGLRVNEAVALGLGAGEPKEIPQWVWNVAKKLWLDFMGRNYPLPTPENRAAFTSGLLFGVLPNAPLNGTPNPDVIRDGLSRASALGGDGALAETMSMMQAGVAAHQLFTEEQLGATLRGFLQSSAVERIAFASGLSLGTRLLQQWELGLIANGGSTRRTVLLALWLNWPEFEQEESVASAYRTMSAAFQRSGQGDLLGDWERFKKITQEVGFRRQTRRKGKP